PLVKRPRVLVLGAGAAGLMAARTLAASGIPVLVVEARPRIGGRIFTIRDPHLPVAVELGAQFVHGRPDVAWGLLREAHLTAFGLPFDHYERRGPKLVHASGFEDELARAMKGLARLGRDLSFAEYLRRHRRGPSFTKARRVALHFVQGFDAADPE